MLALTRKKGESIIIGDDIEITILNILGEQIKIGIEAPKSVSIHRKEVYISIKEENKKAAVHKTEALDGLKTIITIQNKDTTPVS